MRIGSSLGSSKMVLLSELGGAGGVGWGLRKLAPSSPPVPLFSFIEESGFRRVKGKTVTDLYTYTDLDFSFFFKAKQKPVEMSRSVSL